jgi:anti-sigma regulatory factor (Ser/Thr protein kinase)
MTDSWPRLHRRATLDSISTSAQAARHIVRNLCEDAHLADRTTETALLLVSELVTNAVIHGSGEADLAVDLHPELMHISVSDDAPGIPQVAHEPVLSEHGRGLFLVASLASRWGVDVHEPIGKTVWFELDHPQLPI